MVTTDNFKVTLEFKDKRDAIKALYVDSMYYVLWELEMNGYRTMQHWLDANPGINPYDAVEEVFRMIRKDMEHNGIMSLLYDE